MDESPNALPVSEAKSALRAVSLAVLKCNDLKTALDSSADDLGDVEVSLSEFGVATAALIRDLSIICSEPEVRELLKSLEVRP